MADSTGKSVDPRQMERAQKLYDLIRQTANKLMHECANVPIEILAKRDPSLEEIAQAADKLGTIVTALAIDFDPMMAQKAFEYTLLMKRIALAVRNSDAIELSTLVSELQGKPGT